MKGLTYAESGVDIHAENRSIDAMKAVIRAKRKGFGAPMTEIGHYAGLLDMGDFALAMTTDGVGSKVLIASAMKKWDTVGIDCIAMNVNDLLAIGAEPIAFVDYLAVESVDPERAGQLAVGLQRGAEISNMTIVGGETASLPEIIKGFDLAGTAVGVVDKDRIVTGEKIGVGDVLVGVPSVGLHSNGYTLARRIIAESRYTYFDPLPVFRFLQEQGGIEDAEMYRTFNMGMGFVVVVPEEDAKTACQIMGKGSKVIGSIIKEGLKAGKLEF
jgi:phosphoribosylformylglycinamidine cyclo-ligase